MISPTQTSCDAIVIGAGPAGAFAAFQLAKAGKKVILIDKAQFPRTKVCGCCINATARNVLLRGGLGDLLRESGAVPLSCLRLIDGDVDAKIKLSGGQALSRHYFDNALINAAVAEGVQFMPGMSARVLPGADACAGVRIVEKELPFDCGQNIEGRIIIVADGLNGHSLDQLPEFASVVAADSRFGVGTTFQAANSSSYYQGGTIYMACDGGGYVGLVVLEDGGIDIACALDRSYVKEHENLSSAVATILEKCGLPLPVPAKLFHASQWQGTASLTRHRPKIAGRRLFVIGDACGYPEPLTGEGIAWALESAEAVLPLALSAIDNWSSTNAQEWQKIHGRLVRLRQYKSRVIAYSLRYGFTRRAVIKVLASFPALAEGIAASLTVPVKQSVVPK